MKVVKLVLAINLLCLWLSGFATVLITNISVLYECNPITKMLASVNPLLVLVNTSIYTLILTAMYLIQSSASNKYILTFTSVFILASLPPILYMAWNDLTSMYNVFSYHTPPDPSVCPNIWRVISNAS